MFNGRDYNPVELLDFCQFSNFDGEGFDLRKNIALEILSLVVTNKNHEDLPGKIANIVENYSKVTMGRALHKLSIMANIGNELQGGLDGLDALTYHLSGHTCTKAIEALNKIMKRFDEIEIK